MKLEKVSIVLKRALYEIILEVKEWQGKAHDALEKYKIDAWHEWALKWLVLSLFVRELQEIDEEDARSVQDRLKVVEGHVCIEGIKEKFKKM